MHRYTSIQHERRIKGIPPLEALNSPPKDETPHKEKPPQPVLPEQPSPRKPPIPAKKDSKHFS